MGSLYLEKLVQPILTEMASRIITAHERICAVRMKSVDYFQWHQLSQEDGSWAVFLPGDTWGGVDAHFCFKSRVVVPDEFLDRHVVCRVATGATDIWNYNNPQFLAYVNGVLICGLDVNHTEFDIPPEVLAAGSFDLGLFAYANSGKKDAYLDIELAVKDDEVEKLYYDLKLPFDVIMLLHDEDEAWLRLAPILSSAANMIDLRQRDGEIFRMSIAKASRYLAENLYDRCSSRSCDDHGVIEHCIGHTHIDVAWLWTLDQTREKVVRSFASALYLMDKYPEFKFMSSQPVLYEFVREMAPDIYRKIQERVAEGRWEVEGCMWLEADCNLTSGESLVRQILYGKKFFKEEFGKENTVLWLPDVFGYSAAMPQIMKKSGIEYFMTTKIAWNDTNRIPHDTLYWKGIDGTKVLTHFITTASFNKYEMLDPHPSHSTTYNGTLAPKQVKGCWQRYQDKELNREILQCYGSGDGGGGPTAEMLENARRMSVGLPGCPTVAHTFVGEYFHALERTLGDGKKVPVWTGELYLEFHRGTYTSMARNKKFNRLAEFALADAEFFSCLALWLLSGRSVAAYPLKELSECWKLALLNQFHDILPGSAIKEVYDESEKQYRSLFARTGLIIGNVLDVLCGGIAGAGETVTVFNTLGWLRTDLARIESPEKGIRIFDGEIELPSRIATDGALEFLAPELPPSGYKTFRVMRAAVAKGARSSAGDAPSSSFPAAPKSLRTFWYDVVFDADGFIVSLYDRSECREVIMSGARANILQVFDDRPVEYDAWNIDQQYAERMWEVRDLSSSEIIHDDGLGVTIRQTRKFLSSFITQEIEFHSYTRRIDFRTTVEWHESHLLLKVAFPVEVMATRAAYEIQFGLVERDTHRNTSWDEARFEVCAQKWADLSEGGYGVSLMNDCKYGYDIHDTVLRLSLLRSPVYPNPDADQGTHEFTYALFPHRGTFRDSCVVHEAFQLNCVPYTRLRLGSSGDGIIPASFSLFSVNRDNVIMSAIKKAESDDSVILRLYESCGTRVEATVSLPYRPGFSWSVEECSLLEEPAKAHTVVGRDLSFTIKPFEIKTFRVSSHVTPSQNMQ